MNRCYFLIAAIVVCVLVLLILLLSIFIPRSKMREITSSSISNITSTTTTMTIFTISDNVYYQSESGSTSKYRYMSSTLFYLNAQTTTKRTESITSNKMTTSTANQLPIWIVAASLNTGRSEFACAILTNGRILVAGGFINSNTIIGSSEIYSAMTGWQSISAMIAYRYRYTLTSFANKTKALAVGTAYKNGRQSAEIFNSANNTWSYTRNTMSYGRYYHTATLLENGQILIVGGMNNFNLPIAVAEIYDPGSDSFKNASSMYEARFLCTSTLLNDRSTIFVAGGVNSNFQLTDSAELYINGSWIRTNNNMVQPRASHAAVLLNDGNVLIAGGSDNSFVSFATAEIYNATTRTFTAVSSMKYRRAALTLTLLPSGKVLATGGVDWNTKTYPKMCELYDPLTRTWSDTNMLNYGRSYHQTILLNDSVLTIGGRNGSDSTRIAVSEKYYL